MKEEYIMQSELPKTLSQTFDNMGASHYNGWNDSMLTTSSLSQGILGAITQTATIKPVNYKYHEDEILDELKRYIDSTYSQHYSTNKYQATEFIIDGGHGEGFCIGNIMKYAQRYGKKNGKNKQDLLKVLHYAIIMLHIHNEYERNYV